MLSVPCLVPTDSPRAAGLRAMPRAPLGFQPLCRAGHGSYDHFWLTPRGLHRLTEQRATQGTSELAGRGPEALAAGSVKAASDTFSIGVKNCKHFLVERKSNK